MCDEERIAANLKRKNEEEFTVNLAQDITSFFAQKYGISSCDFRQITSLGEEMARVDFTVSRGSDFNRRYFGDAGYVDGHLSLAKVIRLI